MPWWIVLWYWLLWGLVVLTILAVLVSVMAALGLASGACWIVGLRRASQALWRGVERLADLADAL